MADASGLSQEEYRLLRNTVAWTLADGEPAPYEVHSAELLIDAGFIDIEAVHNKPF